MLSFSLNWCLQWQYKSNELLPSSMNPAGSTTGPYAHTKGKKKKSVAPNIMSLIEQWQLLLLNCDVTLKGTSPAAQHSTMVLSRKPLVQLGEVWAEPPAFFIEHHCSSKQLLAETQWSFRRGSWPTFSWQHSEPVTSSTIDSVSCQWKTLSFQANIRILQNSSLLQWRLFWLNQIFGNINICNLKLPYN